MWEMELILGEAQIVDLDYVGELDVDFTEHEVEKFITCVINNKENEFMV
jgi:hypothetical protein